VLEEFVVRRSLLTMLAIVVLIRSPWAEPAHGLAALPVRLERDLATLVKLSPEEHRRLAEEAPVTKLLETNENEEIAAALASDRPPRGDRSARDEGSAADCLACVSV